MRVYAVIAREEDDKNCKQEKNMPSELIRVNCKMVVNMYLWWNEARLYATAAEITMPTATCAPRAKKLKVTLSHHCVVVVVVIVVVAVARPACVTLFPGLFFPII